METEPEHLGESMQILAFRVGEEEYCVEVERVRSVIDIVEITRMPRAPQFVKGIINLRGQIIAVVDLAERLGLEIAGQGPAPRIAVIESRDMAVGAIVDSPEVLSFPVENIEPVPDIVAGELDSNIVKGVVKVDDRLLVLLDTEEILSAGEWKELEEAGTGKAE